MFPRCCYCFHFLIIVFVFWLSIITISYPQISSSFCYSNNVSPGFSSCDVFFRYPELQVLHVAKGHCGTCICIDFDPTGKHFAVGSADASVSIWLVDSFVCVRMIPR